MLASPGRGSKTTSIAHSSSYKCATFLQPISAHAEGWGMPLHCAALVHIGSQILRAVLNPMNSLWNQTNGEMMALEKVAKTNRPERI